MSTYEASNLRCRLNQVKDVIRNMTPVIALDLHKHVSGIEHPGRLDPLITAHFDNGFSGNQHLTDFTLQISITNARFQTIAHFFLMTRISMKYEPLLHQKLFFLRRGL